MPSEVELPVAEAGVHVRLSPVNELIFALFVLTRSHSSPGKWKQPWLRELIERDPEFIARVSNFWDDALPEWIEFGVYADAAGALWDLDPRRLIRQLPGVASRNIPLPAMESETPEVRAMVGQRLERLRTDPQLRERYATLLVEAWEKLEPYWERGGRQAANELAQEMQRRLESGTDFRQLLPERHFARRESHAQLVAGAVASGRLVLVPLGLAGIGMGMLDFPSALVVSVGPDSDKGHVSQREKVERAAGRFKVLSDPTRLSMLASLIVYDSSISELASGFDVSQPTASVHVKMLREAGLLEWEKVRGQTIYRAKPETLREYVESALGDIAGAEA